MKRLLMLLAAVLLAAAPATAQTDAPIPRSAAAEGNGEFEMVLVHGLGSNADVWTDMRPYLGKVFTTWAFELSGHGATQPVLDPTVESEALRLAEFLEAEGITYPTVVGHGIGGMVALRFALDHPHLCHRLILLDSVPRQLGTDDEKAATATRLAEDYNRFVYSRYARLSSKPDITERIVDTALRTHEPSFTSVFMSTMDFDVTEELNGLSVPMLIVGSEMMFPSNEDSHAILEAVGFGHARALSFKRLALAGHFVMLERPVYLASVLMAFGVTAEYEFEH
ncbi:MAG: alpha/beta hydrolase [bacterium]|nr:alpha/beta hydrolase [bacterium]